MRTEARRKLSGEDLAGSIALLLFLLLPALVEDWWLADLSLYFTYAILAASLALVWGHCGLLSLGHAVFFGIGAYAMSVLTLGMLPGFRWLVSSWAGLLFAVLLAALFAWVLGHFLFSAPRLRGPFFGIVMLAVAFIAERLAINWNWLGGLNGLMNVPPLTLGLNGGPELWDSRTVYFLHLAVLAATLFGLERLRRSRRGILWAAIRSHEERTRSLGYDTLREKVHAFVLGASLAALAGALFVTQFGFASPSLIGFNLSAEVLIWVAVGGRRSPLAAALGAIAVRWAESRFSAVLGDWWLIVLGLAFILVVTVLPEGLLGSPIRRLDRLLVRRHHLPGDR